MTKKCLRLIAFIFITFTSTLAPQAHAQEDTTTLRVFIFAGQSNMVGSHSSAKDVNNFPPFVGAGIEQENIKYTYAIGRENMMRSEGWTTLQPVNNVVGPELSFGQKVSREIEAPIAIIKCASGGTDLGGDWNPDDPSGFKLYPLALKLVKDSLKALDEQNIKYRVEGFMWHQGENDMFNADYKAAYAKNLENFIGKWRRDLNLTNLRFYIGELSTKTVWGMDNRMNMYTLSLAQKKVCEDDPLTQYIPTNHVGVRTKSVDGLHYHYGTLGQLEHGYNYATAYLNSIGKLETVNRPLEKWPFEKDTPVKLFVLAGHRNMEGEVAFTEDLKLLSGDSKYAQDNQQIPFSYNLGGGYKVSNGWEPLGPAGMYGTFGPELSFGFTLQEYIEGNIAIAKFTHSGSQIIDWTPEGSQAKSRNLYPKFISFIQAQIKSLEDRGHTVQLEGIFYHLGENDMSYGPYKTKAIQGVKALVDQSRIDLGQENLKWFISQQTPPTFKGANETDVIGQIETWAKADTYTYHIKAFGQVNEEEHILMDVNGIVQMGFFLTATYVIKKDK